jgi:hypothetical protein
MGDKEFHEMLGRLFDTNRTDVTNRIYQEKDKEQKLREKASEWGIMLDDKDVRDLIGCFDQIHKVKENDHFLSPRN